MVAHGSGATFAEVRVTPEADRVTEPGSANDHGALELHLRRGRRVIVRPGFDRQTLRELVAVLEACEPTAGTNNVAGENLSRKRGPGRETDA